MLKWKRLDLLLEAARRLVRDGLDFELELIGDGEAREALVDACAADPLGSRVRFHPPTTPENVHAAMARADVYVFPSSREEGWGVVVNEAMAAGCCVVASDAAGAPPWLIEHGETGVLFKSGSATDLTRALAMVIRWTAVRREVMGRRAWESMASTWSPRVAAQRLVALAERLGGPGAPPDFGAGPCSRCG
jgi:glycosyltransferase involved in cell wall biosynthesis